MGVPAQSINLGFYPAHKLYFYVRRLARRHAHVSPERYHAKSSRWIWPSRFTAEMEKQFWWEHNAEALRSMQVALLLGAAGFLAFILFDALSKGLSLPTLMGRALVVLTLAGLFFHLHRQASKQSAVRVSGVAGVATVVVTLGLVATLLAEGTPTAYVAAWPGLLPIYFFTYGQLVMPLAATLLFGWGGMIALASAGYLVGVESATLLPPVLILFIVNLFGLCTRCQLEAYSRNSFRQRRKAECSAEDKALFLRQTSHNLRQPLQALSCYSTVLDNALAHNRTEESHVTAVKLGAAIDELNDTVNRILDISNLESGKQIPLIAEIEINPLLSALAEQFAAKATQRGITLSVRLRTQPPFTVRSDANMLRQILSNLVDNAIKYTNSGWVMVATSKVSATRLKLHVCDSGIGIADGEKADIFKEFYRGHQRQNGPQVHGLGIGLAYVTKAMERLPEHALAFHSQPERGTNFYLRLPYTAKSIACTRAITSAQRNVNGSYVFLVDEDAEVRHALSEQLQCWGCLVEEAASLAEVRQLLAEGLRPPDLLISDFYLSQNVTAHDVLAAIHADCGPAPAIILSTHAIPKADRTRWTNSIRHLRKPASAAALLEAMCGAMGKPL